MSSSIEWTDINIECPGCGHNENVSMYIEIKNRSGEIYRSIASGGHKCSHCLRWITDKDLTTTIEESE